MNQRWRLPVPQFLADYGTEFARHIVVAAVAFLLAIPVRHAQLALHQMAHERTGHPPAIAQLWPSRGAVPVALLR